MLGIFLFIKWGCRLANALVTNQHQGDDGDPFEYVQFSLQKYAHQHRLDEKEASGDAGDVVVWDS